MNNAKNKNIFPYLERLLDGEEVQWKTIEEVCDIVKAASKLKSGDYCVSGKVPIIDQGAQYIAGYTDKELATIPKDEYIIFGDHTETIKFVDFEFVQGADGLKILHTQKALSKYVYYAFSNFYKKTASYKRHWSKAKETSIPIPPLRVQARIVEILDKFTQLEAELEAELEARRKQYAYYRDQLLNFSQYPPLNVNIEWKTLGEMAEIGTGSSNRQDEAENGVYPFYVRSKNILRSSTYQFDETAIIIPGEGGIGDIFHYTEGKYALHQRAYRIKVNAENELFPKFLFYYMTNAFKPFILSRCVGATATSIRKPMLTDFPIPIPPLSEQRRIVDILDRFDTLTNSISEGLPKEIALRRKQYAYYRDALLSFPRPEVSA